jgi:RNA polymerase sigma-70 factor, ECF subfamily
MADKRQIKSPDLFVRLLAMHERRLNGFVLSLVPNWTDAEEIIQETKLRLWQQFEGYEPEKDFGAWATTIAYFQVLTYRNSSHSRPALLGQHFLETVAKEFLDTPVDLLADRHSALSNCLQKLVEAKRALLRRCYSGTETIAQIASQLGREPAALRQELLRIRQKLHKCIDLTLREEK